MTTNPTLDHLPPWAKRPFELLYHAEIHFQKGSDYDKRLSVISFDNSIEVSITTYLSLKPMQRDWINIIKKKILKNGCPIIILK
jgi:hypothetical protein